MAVNKKNVMTCHFFVVLVMELIGVAIIVKGTIITLAERQYWQDVANHFVKGNVTVKPSRGNILSSDDKLMASPLPEHRIYMDFKAGGQKKDTTLTNHLGKICEGLHRIFLDKNAVKFKRHLLKGYKKGSRNYLIYPKHIFYIQYKEAKRLPVFDLNKYKGGFHKQTYNQHKRLFSSLAARTLGDLYADTAQGTKNGIELVLNTLLEGRGGTTYRQKVVNKYLDIVDIAPVDGYDIISTIDADMQDVCGKALVDKLEEINANVGVVVLMEVQTGEVKAVTNMMETGDGEYYEMRNNAISDVSKPGSTFKTVSIMVALENGKITLDIEVDTGSGVTMMRGHTMKDHNWRRGGCGKINTTRILEVSSNIGVSHLIDEHYGNNPQKLVDGPKRIGINRLFHLQIAGEDEPDVHGPKERYFSETILSWMSIGYGAQVPPLNILAFYNAIASNGTVVRPKSVKAAMKDGEVVHELPTEVIDPKICSDHTLIQTREILHRMVSEGSVEPVRSKQLAVAGKTGTTQISRGATGYKVGRVNYLVSFCGYFPAEVPRYNCTVPIREPGLPTSGGLVAGNVFNKTAERVYAKNLRSNMYSAIDSTTNMTPTVRAEKMDEALYVLDALDVPVQKQFEAKKGQELQGHSQAAPSAVILQNQKSSAGIVPSVVDMGAKDAVYLLERKELRVRFNDVDKAKSQSISGSSRLARKQTISLMLH